MIKLIYFAQQIHQTHRAQMKMSYSKLPTPYSRVESVKKRKHKKATNDWGPGVHRRRVCFWREISF